MLSKSTTNDLGQFQLSHQDALIHGDFWVAAICNNGKDWVQIGSTFQHFPGKSHLNDCCFYPTWGDNSNLVKDQVWMIWSTKTKEAKFEDVGRKTWRETEHHAKMLGGRLLTLYEVRTILAKRAGEPKYDKQFFVQKKFDQEVPLITGDMWIAVKGRDWVQVGSE